MKRSIPYPRNILCSFHYYRDYDFDKLPNLNIIGDSGAFSAATQGATITIKELATWAKRWNHRLQWVASLDVIGDQTLTYKNWRDIVDDYGIQAVPTIHFGTDPKELDKYARKGCDFIGLGGLVGKSKKPSMRWLIQVFKYQQRHHPDMRFHGWGCTSQHHALLPFYSVDSSSWLSSLRYGQMILRHPRTGQMITYRLDGRDVYRPEVSRLLTEYYGFNPATVATSNAANREIVSRLSALAASVQEQQLRKKHPNITPPSWGIKTAQPLSAHLATSKDSGATGAIRIEKMQDRSDEQNNGARIHLATSTGNANPQQFQRYSENPPCLHLAGTAPSFPQLNEYAAKDLKS